MKKSIIIITSIILSFVIGIITAMNLNTEEEPTTLRSDNRILEHYTFRERDERTFGYFYSDDSIAFEGLYGIRINTKNNNITYTLYSHTNGNAVEGLKLYKDNDVSEFDFIKDLPGKDLDKPYQIKLESDGIYFIKADFTKANNSYEGLVKGYIVVKNGKAQACDWAYKGTTKVCSYDKWSKLMSNTKPEDCLDESQLSYPTRRNYHCVKEMQNLSDELILSDDWSDEIKVFAFANYIVTHYAYDVWRCNHDMTRAKYYNNYNDPKNFILETGCGVCWDFTNIMVIMCRHHNIPCTSVENNSHAANAVWLNGEWVCIDLTPLAQYQVQGLDYTDVLPRSTDRWYKCYGVYSSSFDSVGREIWTYK